MDLQLKKYKKNEIIYHMEDIPQAIGIVKEGSVVIETVDFLGNVSLLSHIGPNQMFAESYALTKTPMYVYVRAIEDCTIQFLDVQTLEKSPELKNQMIQILSNKNKMLSQHIFHISNKTIRNKVLSYLSFMKLPTHSTNRMELRSPDCSCNIYLAYALLIYAGLEGIEKNMVPDPCTDIVSSDTKKLPQSLKEAKVKALNSDWLKQVLGKDVVDIYVG